VTRHHVNPLSVSLRLLVVSSIVVTLRVTRQQESNRKYELHSVAFALQVLPHSVCSQQKRWNRNEWCAVQITSPGGIYILTLLDMFIRRLSLGGCISCCWPFRAGKLCRNREQVKKSTVRDYPALRWQCNRRSAGSSQRNSWNRRLIIRNKKQRRKEWQNVLPINEKKRESAGSKAMKGQ
jgi:hypothetical protein